MCGLLGMAGRGLNSTDRKWLANYFLISQTRGIDSTGLLMVDPPTSNRMEYRQLFKEAITASEFVYNETKFKGGAFDNMYAWLYMGHVRWATVGAVNAENAHPFETKSYVGAHNGTLVKSKYKHPTKTDSQMMFEDIEKVGLEEVLSELGLIDAYAISLYEKDKDVLYLTRNTERSLHFAIHRTRGTLYWGSDYDYLKLSLSKEKIEHLDFYSCRPGVIYKFDLYALTHPKGRTSSCFTETEVKKKNFFGLGEYLGSFLDRDTDDEVFSPPKFLLPPTSGNLPENSPPKNEGKKSEGGKESGVKFGRCSLCLACIPEYDLGKANAYHIQGKPFYACDDCSSSYSRRGDDIEHAVYSCEGYPHPYDDEVQVH